MSVILYFHGFRSKPSGPKLDALVEMFPEHEVVGVEYLPHNPVKAMVSLFTLHRLYGDDVRLVVGTSMGGFWARWYSALYNVPGVAINPSLEPWATLKAGTYDVYGENINIYVTEEDIETFSIMNTAKPERVANVIALDDEVINPYVTMEYVKDETIFTVSGGHRFENIPSIEHVLRYAIESL